MPNNSNVTTLFLDIGGVILSDGWGHGFRRRAAEKFDLDFSEMETRHQLNFNIYEEGILTLTEYLDRVVFYKQRDFTHDQFRDFMFSLTTPDMDMIALMKKLKEQYRLKIVAVSDEARELNAFRIKEFKLNSFIDFFISSCFFHVRKPDNAIFQMALDAAQVPASEIIYIDDLEMFVEVAENLGIKSIRHVNYLSTTNALAAMGLLIKPTKIIHA